MLIDTFFVEFLIFGVLGWVYECIYCMFRDHRWQNRGFLFGPICPIYGFCIVSGDIILRLTHLHFGISAAEVNVLLLFICCMSGSAIVEYVTSYVLEKRFHARWWDYSDIPLNFEGRISLPTSIGFGIMGTVIAKCFYPAMRDFFDNMTEISALIGMGVISADIALTEANLHDLLDRIKDAEERINVRMENTYKKFEDIKKEIVLQEKMRVLNYRNMTFYHRNIINNIRSMPSDKRNAILQKLKDEIREKIDKK